MLPMPDTTVWSSSARLSAVRRRRMPATVASRSKAGSIGSRAMWATGAGSRSPPTAGSAGLPSPVIELEPEVLAAAAGTGDRAADQACGEVGRTLDMPADRPRVRHGDLGDLAVENVIG